MEEDRVTANNEELKIEETKVIPDLKQLHNVPEPKANDKVPSQRNRVIGVYRYVGDIKDVDMSSPKNARRCLEMVLGCVENQKSKIRTLRKYNRDLNRQVRVLENEILKILTREIVNQGETRMKQ